MKAFILFFALMTSLIGSSYNFPKFNGPINDAEELVPPFLEKRLTKKINKAGEVSQRQLILITTGNFGTKSNSKDFLIALYKQWKLKKKDLVNAVVLFISKSKNEVRLFVGSNITKDFSKVDRQIILDQIIRPKVFENNYKVAIKKGMKAILNLI